jgi:Putative peptidoglycan binding domain
VANYTLLYECNVLPAVGVLQKLLNRGGANLAADGIFGPKTKQAVIAFQKPRGLKPDGAVGVQTWPRVSVNAGLPIMDCVDVFDPLLEDDTDKPLKAAGGNPIVVGGLCNGVEQAVNMIVSASPGGVFLLRFHGHGGPGQAGVAIGQGDVAGAFDERSDINDSTLNEILPILGRLRPIFGPYGCVQFMHCETGRGPRGQRLLRRVAEALGVPATGAVNDQSGTFQGVRYGSLPFGYDGPTTTECPGGVSLKDWARALPDFAGASVM